MPLALQDPWQKLNIAEELEVRCVILVGNDL